MRRISRDEGATVVTTKEWLRTQVARMERQICESDVFRSEEPASVDEIRELKQVVIIHAFLQQELTRLEARAARHATLEVPVELASVR
jgi:hypothetical protein